MDRKICTNYQLYIPKNGMDYNYFYVTETCSRACAGCLSGAPIAKSGKHKIPGHQAFASLENIEKGSKWTRKYNNDASALKIDISGGDPMLHPKLYDMFEIIRKDHPDANLKVRCNGMGLDRMSKEKWAALRKWNVAVDVRPYLLEKLIEWKKEAANHKVRCDAIEFGLEHPINFNSIQHVPKPKVSSWNRYLFCSEFNRCVGLMLTLDKPRYYKCSLPMSWLFIQENWPDTKAWDIQKEGIDYFSIDIDYDQRDIWSINPPTLCAHCCRGESPLRYSANTPSKKIRCEYVLDHDTRMEEGYPPFCYNTPEWISAPVNPADVCHQNGIDHPTRDDLYKVLKKIHKC